MTRVFHDSEIKQWTPPLIQVTIFGYDRDDNTKHGFIDPLMISHVYSRLLRICIDAGDEATGRQPVFEERWLTTIQLKAPEHLVVLESPREIALRRDAALGHKPTLGSVP